jgi:hypothetical protein
VSCWVTAEQNYWPAISKMSVSTKGKCRNLKRGQMVGEYVLPHKSGTPIPIRYRVFVFPDGCAAAIWEPIQDWRELYLAALVEVNPSELRSKLDIALLAVQQRMCELHDFSAGPDNEPQALRDAASALQSLWRSS